MITKNFIKQCGGAEEIQKGWKPIDGDKFIYEGDSSQEIFIYKKESNEPSIDVLHKILIWLPTQEQLWEKIKEIYFTENSELMIRNDLRRDMYFASIYTEIDDNIHTEDSEGRTVKECLLKLIMKEYCKIWTGEKWVVANE